MPPCFGHTAYPEDTRKGRRLPDTEPCRRLKTALMSSRHHPGPFGHETTLAYATALIPLWSLPAGDKRSPQHSAGSLPLNLCVTVGEPLRLFELQFPHP